MALSYDNAPMTALAAPPRFAEATIDYFTQAFCHELALEISRRTGWELWACVESPDDCEPQGVHALVRMPGGLFLDVRGPQTAAEACSHWQGAVIRRVSARYFAAWSECHEPLDRRRVRRTAERLLALYG
jgi:hypothetical protein